MTDRVRAVLGLLAVVVLWEGTTRAAGTAALVPPPSTIVATGLSLALGGELTGHLLASVRRVLVGYAVAALAGVPVGLLIGWFRGVEALVSPPMQFVRSISPVAIVPLAIIWFGIGETGKYFIIVYSAIVVIVLSTASGVRSVPVNRVRAARCLGAGGLTLGVRVVLPSAFPYVAFGLRAAIGFAFMGVVAAELVGASEGLGFLVVQAQEMIETEKMFVALVLLGVFGALIDVLSNSLNERALKRYMLDPGG